MPVLREAGRPVLRPLQTPVKGPHHAIGRPERQTVFPIEHPAPVSVSYHLQGSPHFTKRIRRAGKLVLMIKVLFVFGTRPEAIKLCPVLLHLRSRPSEFETRVCVTAQHRHMLDAVLSAFAVP